MTRFLRSSASTRAISRSMVVLPMPGGPIKSTFLPVSTRSWMILAVPITARPTRQVKPTILPSRFLMAEMRCSVRVSPARLSPLNEPMRLVMYSISTSVTSRSPRNTSRPGKRASGRRPRSMTISSRSPSPVGSCKRDEMWGGMTASKDRMSSISTVCKTSPFVGGDINSLISYRQITNLWWPVNYLQGCFLYPGPAWLSRDPWIPRR